MTKIWWGGPEGAQAGDTYDGTRSEDGTTYDPLFAAQAATAPFESPKAKLAQDANYGDANIVLDDATGFAASASAAAFDDALVEYGTLNGNTLEGCVWLAGYGQYLVDTEVINTHEFYDDPDLTYTHYTIRYRITRNSGGKSSDYTDLVVYPANLLPISSEQIILIVPLESDIDPKLLPSYNVECQITNDDEHVIKTGHLIKQHSGDNDNEKLTLADGTTVFGVWSSSSRKSASTQQPGSYTVTVSVAGAETRVIDVPVIPSQSEGRNQWTIGELVPGV